MALTSVPLQTLGINIYVNDTKAINSLTKITGSLQQFDAMGKMVGQTFTGTTAKGVMQMTTAVDEQGRQVLQTSKMLKQYNNTLFGTGDHLTTILAKVAQWTIATGIIFGTVRALRTMVTTISDVDDQMVMLQKVFNGSSGALQQTKEDAIDLSIAMGNLIAPSIEATTIWARMGREGSELSEALRVTLLAQNIAEIEAGEGAKLLNAALIQFNKTIDDGIMVLDEWNELSNRTPVTTRDLAQAVSQAGAVFKVAGAQIEDLNAYTVALSASMAKSGREIGNALKTIASYVKRAESIPKLARIAGVEVERMGEAHLSLDDILLRLASRWSTLTDVQKEEIATTSAGVRRKAFFLSLMENFNITLEAYAVQWKSAGSAVKENEIRLNSLKTKTLQLSAAFQKFSVQAGDRGLLGVLKSVTDQATDAVISFSDLSGGMQAVIGVATIAGGTIIGMANAHIVATKAVQGLTGAMATLGKVGRFIGVTAGVIALSAALAGLVYWLGKEEAQSRKLLHERQKRTQALQLEKAGIESMIQQRDTLKSLIDAREELIRQGQDTADVDGFLLQALEAISEATPSVMRGTQGMYDVYEKLDEKVKGLATRFGDLKKVLQETKEEQAVELLVKESRVLFEKPEYNDTVDVGMSTAVIKMPAESLVDVEHLAEATKGDLESAWNIAIERLAKEGVEIPRDVIESWLAKGEDLSDKIFGVDEEVLDGLQTYLEKLNEVGGATNALSNFTAKITAERIDNTFWDATLKSIEDIRTESERLIDAWEKERIEEMNFIEFVQSLGAQRGELESLSNQIGYIPEFDRSTITKEIERLVTEKKGIDGALKGMEVSLQGRQAEQFQADTMAKWGAETQTLTMQITALQMALGKLDAEQDTATKQYQNAIDLHKRLGERFRKNTESADEYARSINNFTFNPEDLESSLEALRALGSEKINQSTMDEASALKMQEAGTLSATQVQYLTEKGQLTKDEGDELTRILTLMDMILGLQRLQTAEKRKQDAEDERARKELERKQKLIYQDTSENLARYVTIGIANGFDSNGAKNAARALAGGVGDLLAAEASKAIISAMGLAVGGPAAMIVTGLVAGIAGGLADSLGGDNATDSLTDEVEANTLALRENTQAFQDFQERMINAPSSFALPAIKGEIPQFDTGGTVDRSGYAYVDNGEFIGSRAQLTEYFSKTGSLGTNNSVVIENGAIQVNGADNPDAVAQAVIEQIDARFADDHRRGKNISQEFHNV